MSKNYLGARARVRYHQKQKHGIVDLHVPMFKPGMCKVHHDIIYRDQISQILHNYTRRRIRVVMTWHT